MVTRICIKQILCLSVCCTVFSVSLASAELLVATHCSKRYYEWPSWHLPLCGEGWTNPFCGLTKDATFVVSVAILFYVLQLPTSSPLPWSLNCSLSLSHGSESVVRTTSKVNGKCQISGSASSETLGSIFKKFCTVDYVVDCTAHANIGINRFKGGVSAHA